MSGTMRDVLVTGGGGFLGQAVVLRLLARGVAVRVFARGAYPRLEAAGCTVVRGDLGDADALRSATEGCDTVFHVAARAGVWGPADAFEATNVRGTRNVLDACRATGVRRLVHTSSPSVTFDGTDQIDVGEAPYPTTWLADYPRTKARAEQDVLAAASATLHVVALRPHLIYGPGDPHLLPRLLVRARAGRLRIVGDGSNRVSLTYVDNAAAAHLAAADALTRDGARSPAQGRAFFVNDPETVVLWAWLNRLFAELGIPTVTRRVPAGVAVAVGAACETLWRVLAREDEPPMTRFVARQLSTHHTYDLSPARDAFAYAPEVDGEEAFARTVAWARSVGGG
jgi:nucleoside-diphosphate-sugar epimerase